MAMKPIARRRLHPLHGSASNPASSEQQGSILGKPVGDLTACLAPEAPASKKL